MTTSSAVLDHDWWPVPLPGNVTIGERSWLYSSYAFLHYASKRPKGVTIGDDTGIYIGTMFDLGPDAECTIGSFCSVVGPTIATNGRITIGDFAFISYHVVIADSPHAAPPQCRSALPAAAPGEIVIGDNVWMGARATIAGPVAIGEGAVIGAGAVVRENVPVSAIAVGIPARGVSTR